MKPYYQDDNVILYCADWREVRYDERFDLVLTDPPYNTTTAKWDVRLDLPEMWSIFSDNTHSLTNFVFTATQPFTTLLCASNLDKLKYTCYWQKTVQSGFAQAHNMPLKNIEDICVFSNGGIGHKGMPNRMTYNPQGLIPVNLTKKNCHNFNAENVVWGKRPSHKEIYTQTHTNYPTQVKPYANETGLHPTQKPVALFEELMLTYSNEGDTILDPFVGSGTTVVCALRTNRKIVAVDIREECCEIVVKRILGIRNLSPEVQDMQKTLF